MPNARTELAAAIRRANNITGLPIVQETAYGAPRLYLAGPTGVGYKELSPRMPSKALVVWLDAFLTGYELGDNARHRR
jgi:hypothetical protein